MRYRLLSFLLIIASMVLLTGGGWFGPRVDAPPTLALGFLLLAGYLVGFFGEYVKLPRITGYILAGVLFGPYLCGFFTQRAVLELGFLNNLALAFIAFCAGGELKVSNLRDKLRSIISIVLGNVLILAGVTLAVFLAAPFIPFMAGYSRPVHLGIAAIFGVISTARSPSSAIAVISELKARGPFTDVVLAVTVVMDVVVVLLFAIVLSLCQVLITPGSHFSPALIFELLLQIAAAFALGYGLGRGIIFLADRVHVELPVIVAGMGFLVIKTCHLLGDHMLDTYHISLHLEPLIICMAAGFTVQNFSDHGDRFVHSMDRVSMPIYVAFFALSGAAINFEALSSGWMIGLMVVFIRAVMMYVGTYASSRVVGDPPRIYKYAWLGFITQAGVSLGLLAEVVRRFPEVGIYVQSILIAAITVNQIVGPIAFKWVLGFVGEAHIRPARARAD